MKNKEFIQFLKSKLFLKHLLYAIGTTILLIIISLFALNIYTQHGKFILVPDFTGLKLDQLEKFASDSNVRYVITDSIYSPDKQGGTIAMQDPEPRAKIKKNRTVYLTIYSLHPDKINMPNLIDVTLRQAITLLETYGLKVGRISYVEDIAKNAVLSQKHKGSKIEPDTKIDRGSKIDLVVGRGNTQDKLPVPFLYGKTRSEAINIIYSNSLSIGKEHIEDGDENSKLRVYKQEPSFQRGKVLEFGHPITIWLKSESKFNYKELINKHKKDTIADE